MDKFADESDRASAIEAAFNVEREQEVRRAAAPEQDPDNINPECCDCGEPIEEARLKLLKKRCISCQQILERRNKVYGR